MADNLSVAITADVSALQTQLELAKASVRAYAAEVRGLAGQARSAGDDVKGGLISQLEGSARSLAGAKAEVAGLNAALGQGRQAHSEHAAAVREHGGALAVLGEHAREVAAIFGVGFGVDKLVEGLKSAAEWGERTENKAAAIGVDPIEFAKLSGALELVGGSADTAGRIIGILERNIKNVADNPNAGSRQADAFHNLGIGAEQLNLMLQKPIEAFGILADAYRKFVTEGSEPGRALGEFKAILGRGGMEDLVPGIKNGEEALKALEKRWQELTGIRTNKQIEDLAETQKAINEISKALLGVETAIVVGFKDPIIEATHALTEFLVEARKSDALQALGEGVKEIGETFKTTAQEIRALKSFFSGEEAGPRLAGGKLGLQPRSTDSVWSSWWGGLGSVPGTTEDIARQRAIEEAGRGAGFGQREGVATREHESAAAAPDRAVPAPAALGSGVAKFEPTAEERRLLEEIRKRENAGKYTGVHYAVAGQAEPQSIGDVERTKVTNNSHAFGAYGFQPATYRDMAAITGQYGIDQASQDINALALLRKYGPNATQSWAASGPYSAAGGAAPGHRDSTAAKRDLEETIKGIEDKEKRLKLYYETEIEGARGNADKIKTIRDQENRDMIALAQARDAANAKYTGATGIPTTGSDDLKVMEVHKQAVKDQAKEADKVRAAAIAAQESERRIADRREAAALSGVESRRRMGQITVDQAAAEEEQIVANHTKAVERILAEEKRLAEGEEKLAQEVKNRKAELEEQDADKTTKIRQHAREEEFQRGHAIDSEIAGRLSSTIVDTAWHKTTPQKAMQDFIQSQEKKALDAVFTRLLDASGIGKMIGNLGDKALGLLPGAATGAAAAAPLTASATALTGSAASLTGAAAALSGAAATSAGSSAVGAAGTAVGAGEKAATGLFGLGFLGLDEGGVIPSAEAGMVADGKGGRLAVVHPQEMVLPASLSRGFQMMVNRYPSVMGGHNFAGGRAGAGGGNVGNFNFHISAVDAHSVERLFMSNRGAISKALAHSAREFDRNAPY